MTILIIILAYFAILFGISRLASKKADNSTFYRANRRAPWYMVAFGMIGASISGVTFVSVPGMVLTSQMTYLQMCLGFIVGYLVIAFVLLPLYYRLNVTTIYTYLGQRLGQRSYLTGASFFLLSKMTGAAVRFYVVCIILQQFVFSPAGIPFAVNVVVMVLLIWLYTRRGGIGTLVFTDSFQTLCLFTALILIILSVIDQMHLSVSEAITTIANSEMSRIFVFDDWVSPHNFWKQFLSGVFVAIVMTGLDQDMMQKNLTCKTLRDAQKDMCTYGMAFVPANLLFLALGVLLTMVVGTGLKGDEMLPTFIQSVADTHLLPLTTYLFIIGIVAASFSSADSALTSLTTCFCVDILQQPDNESLRKKTHVVMCGFFMLFILLFRQLNSTSLIDAIYILASYTYGPLLGLFVFGLFTKKQPNDRLVPYICIVSPLLCYALDMVAQRLWDYHFGYELLMLNGFAQKDMCTYGMAFVPANLLFLALGVLLTMVVGTGLKGDEMLPTFIQSVADTHLLPLTTYLFIIGIVAASFSSADSALTSLTTCFCVDILQQPDNESLRKKTHVVMCGFFMLFILLFRQLNSTSLIDAIYILASYTYGPLLGLFVFGLFTKKQPNDRLVPYICIVSPLLCYALDMVAQRLWDYHFGYELLMLNGLLTFAGLYFTRKNPN